jgi:hypothetical protein
MLIAMSRTKKSVKQSLTSTQCGCVNATTARTVVSIILIILFEFDFIYISKYNLLCCEGRVFCSCWNGADENAPQKVVVGSGMCRRW